MGNKICTKDEPVIMTDDLLKIKITHEMAKVEGLSYSELWKLVKMDGLENSLVVSLDMEQCCLINIANLWKFNLLTKLVLANNLIEEIEGIENLSNLQYLDLSFNCIKTIRGLSGLSNLLYLNLSFNEIIKLENMSNLKKLESLLVRQNKIQSFNNIYYLAQFKNLFCLSISENPFTEEDNRLQIISVLPQLKFLDYNIITENDLKEALSKYPDSDENHDAMSKRNETYSTNDEQFSSLWKRNITDKEAFVDGLACGQGFDTFLECDSNFRFLLTFSAASILVGDYRMAVSKIFDQWHDEGLEYYKKMESERMQFIEAVKEAQKFSLHIFENEENDFITFKEKVPEKLCIIYQQCKTLEEKESALKKLREKCNERLLEVSRNLLNASCLHTALIYEFKKVFEREIFLVIEKYLLSAERLCESLMKTDDVYILELMKFYFGIFDSGSNFEIIDDNYQAKEDYQFLQLLTKKEFVEMTLKMASRIHSSLLEERIKKLKAFLQNYVTETFNVVIEKDVLVKQNEQTRNTLLFCNKQKFILDKLFSDTSIFEHYLGYN